MHAKSFSLITLANGYLTEQRHQASSWSICSSFFRFNIYREQIVYMHILMVGFFTIYVKSIWEVLYRGGYQGGD